MYLDFHTHKIKKHAIYSVIVGEEMKSVPQTCFSAGIHPWYITNKLQQMEILELLLKQNKCLFVGECGLDKLKGEDLQIQQELFIRQIKLSEQYQKPMVLHCVKAYNEVIQLHKQIQPLQTWVIHGFNKGKELANQLVDRMIYLSFGMDLFNSGARRKALAEVPLNQLFLETDENETHTIQELYALASEILNISVQELKTQIESNLWRITGWNEQNC